MTRRIWFLNITFFLSAHWCTIEAGPVERSVRVLREVYPEIEPEKVERNQPKVCIVQSLVYGVDEAVPSDQPCLSCKCQPPDVHCETKLCALKPGCRAIHKPNKCCPEYQCECEHEGKTYANGERLETTPGGECKVCYCRGGEVQCAEVSCYIRTDCEGRLVQGQCCPKYEHCPPIESPSDKVQLKPEPHDKPTPESTVTSTIDPVANSSAENEIVETTTVLQNAPVKKSHKPEITEAATEPADKANKSTQTDDLQNEEPPKITIHEIIPETTLTASPVVEETGPTQHESASGTNQSNDVAVLDSELESSEVSEVFQVPPVLRIGDKLLFLKKGELVPEKDASTPSPVFTIIGAEGLQRGDVDSLEHHEQIKEHAEVEMTTVLAEAPKEIQLVVRNIDENATDAAKELKIVIKEVNKNVSSTAVKPTDANDMTEKPIAPDQTSTENTINLQTSNSTIDVAVELATVANFDITSTKTTDHSANPVDMKHTTEHAEHTETDETKVKSEEVILENPAYPPIPDIMSEQGTEYVEIDQTVKDEKTSDIKILPEILEIRNNHTIPQNITNSAWLKSQPVGRDLVEDGALPEFIIKQLARIDLETTTEDATTTNVLLERKETSSRQPPVDSFNTEDLLKFGTVVEIDPLAQNHIKKLTADDDVSGILTQPTPDDVFEIKSRSTETLESVSMEDSGENTTPKTSRRTSYNEDASLAGYGDDTAEAKSSETPSTSKPKGDVEMIDSILKPKNSTHQQLGGHVDKRTVTYDAESDKIFQELDSEIQLMNDGFVDTKTEVEKKKEAEDIFKELLDEVNSSPTPKIPESPHMKEQSVVLKRVSDAIAKFQVQEDRRTLGSNILGILRDFFSSQSYK